MGSGVTSTATGPSLQQISPAVAARFEASPALCSVIAACWAHEPEQRPAARAVVDQLSTLLDESGGGGAASAAVPRLQALSASLSRSGSLLQRGHTSNGAGGNTAAPTMLSIPERRSKTSGGHVSPLAAAAALPARSPSLGAAPVLQDMVTPIAPEDDLNAEQLEALAPGQVGGGGPVVVDQAAREAMLSVDSVEAAEEDGDALKL